MYKKTIIALIFFIMSLTAAYSQVYSVKTGIMDFNDTLKKPGTSQAVLSEISAELGKYQFILLVERSKLGALVKEIEIGQSGLIDPSTVAEAGKIHGLQVIIDGSISINGISARAVHVETGKIIAAAVVNDENEAGLLGKKLAAGIEVYLARENLKKLRNDNPEIKNEFWLEKTAGNRSLKITPSDENGEVKIGGTVSFHFKSDTDGYLTIVDIQPNGEVVVLYPNDFSGGNIIKAGNEYSIPSKDDEFQITVTEPAGTDTVVAFFTMKKADWLDVKKLSGEGFKTVKEGERLSMSRGFSIVATKLTKREWKSMVISIDVEK